MVDHTKTLAEALEDVIAKLKRAGAELPLKNEGTIESAMKGGLSMAMLLIEDALSAYRAQQDRPPQVLTDADIKALLPPSALIRNVSTGKMCFSITGEAYYGSNWRAVMSAYSTEQVIEIVHAALKASTKKG